MSSAFVPLAAYLTPRVPEPAYEPPARVAAPECDEAIRAARRFRAAVSDAVDVALPELLRAIAREVLARELRLEPAEIAAVAAAAIARFGAENVLLIQTHPADLENLRELECECVGDAALQPGDVRMKLRSGTIDLTLSARLEAVLAVWG
ncbi:MAG: hypothetical protein JO113_08325 [Candidatus Eremiobacteraeota bacterium]|nr:hypothetical protein [Candidatus Eremiobacteraeota bacterium]